MKPKVKIVYSLYYFKEVIEPMLKFAQKKLNVSEDDTISVPGSYDIPFEIARSIKEDTIDTKDNITSFKGKGERRSISFNGEIDETVFLETYGAVKVEKN